MRAVILAGGKGTRLRPYTTVLPKPLVPVGDRPILELIVLQLVEAGFDRIDFCLGHLGELIRAFLEESSRVPDGVELGYVWEDEPLGTAGALHLVDPPTEPLLVMNGDILTTLDFSELMRYHRESGGMLTIATNHRKVKLELGVIEGEDARVIDYIEKPTLQYEVSMGIYVYEPGAIDQIPNGHFDFPEVVLKLIAAEERVSTFHFDGLWFDIGTPGDHERAASEYEADPGRFVPVETG